MKTEGSLISRYVALLTPLSTSAAGYLVLVVNDVTGAQVDGARLTCLVVVAATSATAASWKWLTGWQQHERLVADGLAEPRRPAPQPRQERGTRPYARRRHRFTLVTEVPSGTTVPRAPGSRT
jgi:hypothetical protein